MDLNQIQLFQVWLFLIFTFTSPIWTTNSLSLIILNILCNLCLITLELMSINFVSVFMQYSALEVKPFPSSARFLCMVETCNENLIDALT